MLTFSDETKSHPKLFFKLWMMLYTITVYPVDDAIGFQILPVVEGIVLAKKQSRDGICFAIPNKVSKYSLFSFVVSIIRTL